MGFPYNISHSLIEEKDMSLSKKNNNNLKSEISFIIE